MNLIATLTTPLLMRATRVCSWCEKVLTVGTPGAPTSHTICEPCAAKLLEEPAQ